MSPLQGLTHNQGTIESESEQSGQMHFKGLKVSAVHLHNGQKFRKVNVEIVEQI